MIRELLDAGRLHEDVSTVAGTSLRAYACEPALREGKLVWRAAPQTSLDTQIELLPGVATASEVMVARENGFRRLKFFPAESAGGVKQLNSFAGVFRDVALCPTGGITPLNAKNYLALPNVACVGGSWLTPPELLRAGNWPAITELARAASALRD